MCSSFFQAEPSPRKKGVSMPWLRGLLPASIYQGQGVVIMHRLQLDMAYRGPALCPKKPKSGLSSGVRHPKIKSHFTRHLGASGLADSQCQLECLLEVQRIQTWSGY